MQKYENFEIIIVDNYSPNVSYSKIKECFAGNVKVSVIQTNKNIGYARGNNYGVRWRMDLNKKFDYVLIVNNDIIVEDEQFLEKLVVYAESIEDLAVVGPRVVLPSGFIQGPYDKPNPFILIIQYLLPPIWALLRYKRQMVIQKLNIPRKVYRVIGACMLIKAKPFIAVGCFDEASFMQGEEDILAEKFINIGFYSYHYPYLKVLHNHGNSSTSKLGLKKEMFIRNVESLSYYFKKYRAQPSWVIRLYNISARFYFFIFHDLLQYVLHLKKNIQ
jgi:GT2 family glycosyltransferase